MVADGRREHAARDAHPAQGRRWDGRWITLPTWTQWTRSTAAKDRDAGEVGECRVDEIGIVADAAEARVRVHAREDRVQVRVAADGR